MTQRPVELECAHCWRALKTGHSLGCPTIVKRVKPKWVDKFSGKEIKDVKLNGRYL